MTDSEFAAAVKAATDKLDAVHVDPNDLAASKEAIR